MHTRAQLSPCRTTWRQARALNPAALLSCGLMLWRLVAASGLDVVGGSPALDQATLQDVMISQGGHITNDHEAVVTHEEHVSLKAEREQANPSSHGAHPGGGAHASWDTTAVAVAHSRRLLEAPPVAPVVRGYSDEASAADRDTADEEGDMNDDGDDDDEEPGGCPSEFSEVALGPSRRLLMLCYQCPCRCSFCCGDDSSSFFRTCRTNGVNYSC
eukprot:jgi/Ulvmu1/8784/UM048_0039.1